MVLFFPLLNTNLNFKMHFLLLYSLTNASFNILIWSNVFYIILFIKQRLLYNFVYHVRIKLDKIISIKLTLLKPMSHFYSPWKRREMEKWSIGYRNGNRDGYRNGSIGYRYGALAWKGLIQKLSHTLTHFMPLVSFKTP